MDDEAPPGDAGKKGAGGSSKKLIFALVGANVIALGGLGAFVALGSKHKAPAETHASEEGDAHAEEAAHKEPAADKSKEPAKEPSKDAAKAAPAADKPVDEAAALDLGDLGPVVKLGDFTINLNEPGSTRYLRIGIQAEVSTRETGSELRQRDSQLRDIIISYLSGLPVKETQGIKEKTNIRDNLQRRINHVLKTGEVKRIFFIQFIVQ